MHALLTLEVHNRSWFSMSLSAELNLVWALAVVFTEQELAAREREGEVNRHHSADLAGFHNRHLPTQWQNG